METATATSPEKIVELLSSGSWRVVGSERFLRDVLKLGLFVPYPMLPLDKAWFRKSRVVIVFGKKRVSFLVSRHDFQSSKHGLIQIGKVLRVPDRSHGRVMGLSKLVPIIGNIVTLKQERLPGPTTRRRPKGR